MGNNRGAREADISHITGGRGEPPGQYFHGITLHKNGVTANMSLALDHSYGEMILDGECRNTTDHHHDDETTNITNQLVQP